MLKNKKTFACIGLGWVAREVWLPLFQKNFTIVGGIDPDIDAVNQVKTKWPEIEIQQSFDDIIRLQPDITLVAVPNKDHVHIATELLKNDISVLIEKPVCLSSRELDQLRSVAMASNAHIFPSKAACLRGDITQMAQIIENGELGEIRRVDLEWIRASGIPRPGGWFTHKQKSGGGALVDLGWHVMDVGFFLLSYPEILEVSGVSSNDYVRNGKSNTAGWRQDQHQAECEAADVEDSATLFLKTKTNVGIKVEAAWASHNPIDVTRIVLQGSKGKLVLETTFGFSPNRVSNPSLQLWNDGRSTSLNLIEEPLGEAYKKQVRYIRQILDEPLDNESNLRGIAEIVNVIETFYGSNEQQQ